MEKQTGSAQIIIVALLIIVVVLGAGFYFLSPMLFNKPAVTPVVVNQTKLTTEPTVTPTPVSTDSSELIPDITNQTDFDKASTTLNNTTFTGMDGSITQNNSDAATF